MLDFEFSKEHEMVRRTVREFAQAELAPRVTVFDQGECIPNDVIALLAKQNLLALTVSSKYGGLEADPVLVGVIAEELARADISCAVPTFYLVQAAWGHILDLYGTEVAKEAILPSAVKGLAFLGIGSTEPDVGSDVVNMRTVAKRSGDRYVLNGEKMFISGVKEAMEQMPEGGAHLTLAKTNPIMGAKGISLFLVPLKTAKGPTKGISINVLEDWGRRGISTGGFNMDGVELPAEYLVGQENKGFFLAMEGFDYARAIIGVVCCGAAMACLERAMEYIKMRSTFGTPIAKYEGVQFKLAENWTMLEALRLLAYRALWTYGRARKGTATRMEVAKQCAMAKLHTPIVAFQSINDAIQWYGAYGYTRDSQLELALKGVRSYYWAEGAMEIMRVIVARELLGKEYVATK